MPDRQMALSHGITDQSPGVVSAASRENVEDESRFVGDLNPEGVFLNAVSLDIRS
jgi:hypothetical protein